jgi:hypothetical protein
LLIIIITYYYYSSSSLLLPITITHSFLLLEQEVKVAEVTEIKQPHVQGDGGDSKETYKGAKETYKPNMLTEGGDNKEPHAQGGDGGEVRAAHAVQEFAKAKETHKAATETYKGAKETYQGATETYKGAKETHKEATEAYNQVRAAHAAQECVCLEGGGLDPVEATRAWAEAVRQGWIIAAEHACVAGRRRAGQYTFSKVLDIVASYSNFTRALTFENSSQSCAVLHLALSSFAGYV